MQEEKCRIAETPWEEPIHQVRERERERDPCKYIVKSQRPVIKKHIVLPLVTLNQDSMSAGRERTDIYFYMTCPVGKVFPTVYTFDSD